MSTVSRREGTATSSFGVSRREGHDASAFYERFPVPEISGESEVVRPPREWLDCLWVGDARHMDTHGNVANDSVALVVTSPPYFAGKEYEEAVGQGHIPADYVAYLKMLEAVFSECARKLEPGGRIAVNVANLGRRPYRSLSADVIRILQDRLGLLLRGEVIWRKARGAAGNCAWGSFQRPSNPVLRDLTERVVIASKGRFDRAVPAAERATQGLPSEGTAPVDEFLEATTDVWDIPSASATRVGHPAPFPVELPQRLIDLYTYRGDLVLDPFMGAGTTAVAAVRTGRHYVGFDTDASYLELAKERIASEREQLDRLSAAERWEVTVEPKSNGRQTRLFNPPVESCVPARGAGRSTANGSDLDLADDNFQARAVRQGRKAQELAWVVLAESGFCDIQDRVSIDGGVEVNFSALDQRGHRWLFDVSGAFSLTQRPGLRRTDTLWKAIGRAAVLHSRPNREPLVLLTTDRPAPNSAGQRALDAVTGDNKPIRAVIEMGDLEDLERLGRFASGDV